MPKQSKSVSNLLKQNAKPACSSSKVPMADMDALHDQVHEAYAASRDAEARFRALESELLSKVDAMYADNARKGSFSKSYNLPGIRTPGVQVTYQDRFTAIPVDNETALKNALGSNYDRFFEEKRKLSLVDTSDKNIAYLTKALGEKAFVELFQIELTINARKDMDRNQFSMPDDARAYLKQFKASVKLGK